MPSNHIEALDARQLLAASPLPALHPISGGTSPTVMTRDFNDDWQKAQDIISGKAFIAWGDANKDRKLTYAEQFAKEKATLKDANNDGHIDVNDLKVPDRVKSSTMSDAIKYMDDVDWYETGRAAGAKAWINDEGTLAISSSGDMRVETSGKTYIKYSEKGVQIARFAVKQIKRIEVFGSSKADTIRLGDNLGKPVVVYARAGNDTVYGGNGVDTIYGGDGDDQIHGGAGDDLLVGYNGNDRIWGDSGKDRLEGNGGVDRLDGGSGVNKISGGGSIDYLTLRQKDHRDSDRSDKVTMLK